MMKVHVQDVSAVAKRLEIEIPVEEIEREMEALVRRHARSVKVRGFRKGHAPPSLIRRMFARELEEELRESLIARRHRDAVADQGLQPLHDPVVEEVDHPPGEPLRFRTLFEVRPRFDLRAYKGLTLSRPSVEVADGDVDKLIESMREAASHLVPKESGEAADGDVVLADLAGRFVVGEGADFTREAVRITVGRSENLAEFDRAVSGARVGEEKVFPVSYPEGFEARHLAGRTVEYRLTVRDVLRPERPALDDAFAREVGEPAGLQALRDKVRANLVEARRREAEEAVRESAMRHLVEAHPFELPSTLVEEQLRRQMEEIAAVLQRRGVDPAKAEVDWEKLRERQIPLARQRVAGRLVLDEIARQEGIAVSEEEVASRIAEESRRMGIAPEVLTARLEKEGTVQALRSQLLREKTLDFVMDEARIAS